MPFFNQDIFELAQALGGPSQRSTADLRGMTYNQALDIDQTPACTASTRR